MKCGKMSHFNDIMRNTHKQLYFNSACNANAPTPTQAHKNTHTSMNNNIYQPRFVHLDGVKIRVNWKIRNPILAFNCRWTRKKQTKQMACIERMNEWGKKRKRSRKNNPPFHSHSKIEKWRGVYEKGAPFWYRSVLYIN